MKQLVCIVTILTLFLQLASCSKDLLHTKVRTVQKDSEWWNETETVVTPEEIMTLENKIISSVRERFGVELSPEVEHVPDTK